MGKSYLIDGEILGADDLFAPGEARQLVGANFRGVWSENELYSADDSVTYPDAHGAFYVARRRRPDDAEAWEKRGVAVE